jgi:hypothetical protein
MLIPEGRPAAKFCGKIEPVRWYFLGDGTGFAIAQTKGFLEVDALSQRARPGAAGRCYWKGGVWIGFYDFDLRPVRASGPGFGKRKSGNLVTMGGFLQSAGTRSLALN